MWVTGRELVAADRAPGTRSEEPGHCEQSITPGGEAWMLIQKRAWGDERCSRPSSWRRLLSGRQGRGTSPPQVTQRLLLAQSWSRNSWKERTGGAAPRLALCPRDGKFSARSRKCQAGHTGPERSLWTTPVRGPSRNPGALRRGRGGAQQGPGGPLSLHPAVRPGAQGAGLTSGRGPGPWARTASPARLLAPGAPAKANGTRRLRVQAH